MTMTTTAATSSEAHATDVLSLRTCRARVDAAALRAACEAKRAYMTQHVAALYANTNPVQLWNTMLRHCVSLSPQQQQQQQEAARTDNNNNNGDNAASPHKASEDDHSSGHTPVEDWDKLEMTYDGYRAMVHELLFGGSSDTRGEDTDSSTNAALVAQRRRDVYFGHPFLSPATFLAFARSGKGTVRAAPLFAFAAKRLLLFRLRVELELCASVVPLPLRDRATQLRERLLHCRPCASSPLSNALTQDDVERFVQQLVPNLRLVCDVPPWMLPYYLCHASHKFMFMCDHHGVGMLSIDTLMQSSVFSELLHLFESNARDALVPYPAGCVVDVPATLAARGTATVAAQDSSDTPPPPDASDTVQAEVVSFEHDGADAADVYTVRLLDDRAAVRTVRRDHVYWNSAAEEYLPAAALTPTNWFAMPLMSRIYEHFVTLDADNDGMLTLDEFAHYSNDSLTRLAVERVFECYVPAAAGTACASMADDDEDAEGGGGGGSSRGDSDEGGGGGDDMAAATTARERAVARSLMQYKTYLNFVIAIEHAATRPGLRYIWRLLDLDETVTHVSLSTLYCFCKELAHELVTRGMMDVSAQSILSEVVDMVNPAAATRITLDDVERSGQQATVLPILLSYRSFYAYDCREQTAASAMDEYTSVGES